VYCVFRLVTLLYFENKILQSEWVEPHVENAIAYKEQNMYGGGRASCCRVTTDELGALGAGTCPTFPPPFLVPPPLTWVTSLFDQVSLCTSSF
jgi:hypothetical protein